MTAIRLSDVMSRQTRNLDDARETLDDAIIKAINGHFEAGQIVERERIIKLLEKHDSIISRCCIQPVCCLYANELAALIKLH